MVLLLSCRDPRVQDDEIKAPTLLVFGWVEVFVSSRGERVKFGVFLCMSVEFQHTSSSTHVTSVRRFQHHLFAVVRLNMHISVRVHFCGIIRLDGFDHFVKLQSKWILFFPTHRSQMFVDSCASATHCSEDLLVVFHTEDYQVIRHPPLGPCQDAILFAHDMSQKSRNRAASLLSAFKLRRSFVLSFSSINLFCFVAGTHCGCSCV